MKRVRYADLGRLDLAPAVLDPGVRAAVREIFDAVVAGGDEAVREHARELDGLDVDEPLEVGIDERHQAVAGLPDDLREALDLSIDRVREAAVRHLDHIGRFNYSVGDSDVEVRPIPIQRVGAYVPGGRYPLPSTAVMTVVPARAAGVEEIVVCSPRIHPHTVAAAHLSGADRVFRVGGAQAIAAMAAGTKTIPRVDMIVGPGNSYVQAAKAMAFGRVGIDMIAGPTEVMIVADGTAEPELLAADLLAQAEHDVEAIPVLVTTDTAMADAVIAEVERQVAFLNTGEVARSALDRNGLVVEVDDLEQAALVVDRKAPEHLEVVLADPDAFIDRCRNYGCAFIGPHTFEVLGDYVLGTNHVLPTGGAGRYTAGLSVLSFLRFPSVIRTGP
ncbi:MAG: histidinol dehydrogenase, partial [Deltaproteobacteria bacterium]|nr:histidinol dehydrogenase [Deltaproteobacteria bacterium]